MKYEEALRLLGVKRGSSDREIRKAYLQLARMNHPDVAEKPTMDMSVVNTAYQVALDGPAKIEYQPKELLADIKKLRRSIDRTSSPEAVDNAFQKLSQSPEYNTPDAQDRLSKAYDRVREELETYELLKMRSNRRARRIATRALLTPDERLMQRLQEQADQIILREGLAKIKENIKLRLQRIKGRLHIPIVVKGKKKHRRWIPLTAAVLAAILTGKYAYDKALNAYKRKKQILQVIR